MVLDRLFLWIFTVAVLVGSAGIILQAPALYDTRGAIDRELSEIQAATAKPLGKHHKTTLVWWILSETERWEELTKHIGAT